MPLVGDIYGSNGTDLANESGSDNGTLSKRINDINEIPENEITLEQLLMNLANSGNEKHVKLASDLLNLNLVQENISDNLGFYIMVLIRFRQMETKILNKEYR